MSGPRTQSRQTRNAEETRRHAGYGVRPEHYPTVGQALLWTLGKGLGSVFDEAHAAARTKVYELLAQTMRASSNEAAALSIGEQQE